MNLSPNSNILIQGITEPLALHYTVRMKDYGTNIVAGVSPGEGGQLLHDIPVFDMVEQALSAVGSIDTTLIFVHPYSALDAALEAIAAGIRQIILITSCVPPLDLIRLFRIAQATDTLIIGPSSAGILVPGKLLLGSHKSEFYTPGHVGLISHTGFLIHEIAWELTQADIGQSISINLGKDTMIGCGFHQGLKILNEDVNTKAIVLVGQIDGVGQITTAEFIAANIDKPIFAYFAGSHTPPDKRLSDPSATIAQPLSNSVTVQQQIAAFKEAKIPVAMRPSQIPGLVKKALKK